MNEEIEALKKRISELEDQAKEKDKEVGRAYVAGMKKMISVVKRQYHQGTATEDSLMTAMSYITYWNQSAQEKIDGDKPSGKTMFDIWEEC